MNLYMGNILVLVLQSASRSTTLYIPWPLVCSYTNVSTRSVLEVGPSADFEAPAEALFALIGIRGSGVDSFADRKCADCYGPELASMLAGVSNSLSERAADFFARSL